MLSSDYAKCIGRQFIALSVGAVTLLLGHGLLDLQRSRYQRYPEISHGAGMDDRSSGLSGLLLCWNSFVLRVAHGGRCGIRKWYLGYLGVFSDPGGAASSWKMGWSAKRVCKSSGRR